MKKGRRTAHRRMLGMLAVFVVFMALFFFRLIYLQLVHGQSYLAQAAGTTRYRFTISAARGQIVDSEGVVLAGNSLSYDVLLNRLFIADGALNDLLVDTLQWMRQSGCGWLDELPVEMLPQGGHFSFCDGESEAGLTALKQSLGLQHYATADDLLAVLVTRYGLEGYAPEWQRILAGVRYRMQQEGFSNATPYLLAEDVDFETVAVLKEHSGQLPGVQVSETTARSYPDGTLLPGALGRVGKITAEQWQAGDYALRSAGYAMNEWIGQSGLEAALESELHGQDGRAVVTCDAAGRITDNSVSVQPQPGQTVRLTVNVRFQRRVQQALVQAIEQLQTSRAPGSGAECSGGAVVVLDTATGGVLALASDPGYDLNLYSSRYQTYASDPARPLFDRALQGLYAPGSAFKPALALAALDAGIVAPTDTVYCGGVYTYYDDYQPGCLQLGHSGLVNLQQALTYSCNCYFYDVGRRTGLEQTDNLAYALGLGSDVGLEVGSAQGRLTTQHDRNFSDGLVLQAAIGQGNTAVTPLQLATYAGTLANHGVRYQTHLIKSLHDGATGEELSHYQTMVLGLIDSDEAFAQVEAGMIGAANTYSALRGLPYQIACKTGSPQRGDTDAAGNHYVNSVLIAYGPVPEPEIAVAIVLEYGAGGSNAVPLLAEVFAAYDEIYR